MIINFKNITLLFIVIRLSSLDDISDIWDENYKIIYLVSGWGNMWISNILFKVDLDFEVLCRFKVLLHFDAVTIQNLAKKLNRISLQDSPSSIDTLKYASVYFSQSFSGFGL